MSERETVVELPFAADSCPCVEKLRTVLPLTVGIRDGVVQLVSTLSASGGGESREHQRSPRKPKGERRAQGDFEQRQS